MSDQPKEAQQQKLAINVNLDSTPILYTDNILMTTNEYGLVFDACQKLGPTDQLRIVARIGMSRNHAKKLLDELGKLLALTEGQLQTGPKTKS